MRYTASLVRSCLILLLLWSVASAMKPDEREEGQDGALPANESKVIEKWRGTWDVTATRRQPQPLQTVTYVETADWVLNGRYLRTETGRKSDGAQTMSMFWFDAAIKAYRSVVFDSSGLAAELPPGVWNAGAQTMEWKTGRMSPTSYAGHATFEGPDRMRWKALWKDWKGTIILDLEGTSTRRK